MGTQAAAGREHTVVTSPLGELTLVRDGAAMAGPAQVSLLPGTWPAMLPGS